MRLRHIPGSEKEIAQSLYVIQEPREKSGHWKDVFGNNHPIEIEVGMGKGRFIMEKASNYPGNNYIGIERYSSVMLRALQKREQMELSNSYFICGDAGDLTEFFAPGEIHKIYLNFSDPWPKERHAKRRLTSPGFLRVYDQILSAEGVIEFKTDNRALFDYTMEVIPQSGWKILTYTYDLHHDPMGDQNIMTEYEEKFSSKGNAIFKLIAGR